MRREQREALRFLVFMLIIVWAMVWWGMDWFLISGHFPVRMKVTLGCVYSGWVVLMCALIYGHMVFQRRGRSR